MTRITIVQPYVPRYRVPLFDRIVQLLAEHNVECTVAAPLPSGDQALRADAAADESPPWLQPLTIRSMRVRGRWVRWYGSHRLWADSDALVYELGSGCLDTLAALLMKGRRRVAVWGHVVSYDDEPFLNDVLERWQMRRSDMVLAYTPRGEATARAVVGPDRVSLLMNTVDTAEVSLASASLSREEVQQFKDDLRTSDRPLLAYIGGLDSSKRIDFLAAALDELQTIAPEIVVLIGGEGGQKGLLSEAYERGQVRFLGFADARLKALLGATCDLLLMPGRVGLVAVESFALGLPVVTVSGPVQAPEFEYLELGVDSLSTADSPKEYAAEVAALLRDGERLSAMRSATRLKAGWPSLEDMADRYVHGLLQMLEL